jgi:ubiquinone/menaquinone biosynthesis C-methylase UbiE
MVDDKPVKICDIGCGSGNMIEVLNRKFPTAKIVGVDLNEEILTFAKQRFINNENITLVVGSITKIPVEENSMDLITVTEVLEHLYIEDFFAGFSEISRKLKNEGYLLATVPFYEELTFVCCPECGCVFQPYQRMIFEISHNDIDAVCKKNGLRIIGFFRSYNRELPGGSIINVS